MPFRSMLSGVYAIAPLRPDHNDTVEELVSCLAEAPWTPQEQDGKFVTITLVEGNSSRMSVERAFLRLGTSTAQPSPVALPFHLSMVWRAVYWYWQRWTRKNASPSVWQWLPARPDPPWFTTHRHSRYAWRGSGWEPATSCESATRAGRLEPHPVGSSGHGISTNNAPSQRRHLSSRQGCCTLPNCTSLSDTKKRKDPGAEAPRLLVPRCKRKGRLAKD